MALLAISGLSLALDANFDISVKVVKPKKTFKSMISGFSSVRCITFFGMVASRKIERLIDRETDGPELMLILKRRGGWKEF